MENTELTPEEKSMLFHSDEYGLFNASALAKMYGKDVYGYTRGQKVKDLVRDISLEYGLDPELEFTHQGNIVRVITGGASPGTRMHLDIFIKFLGWLDPKLERDFLKSAFAANKKSPIDPLQGSLARIESDIKNLKRKLSRIPSYKELIRKNRELKRLQREIEKEQKSMRASLIDIKKEQKRLE